jgi:hypothetical protein
MCAVPASPEAGASLAGDLIQSGYWHFARSGGDSAHLVCLPLAGRESPPGSSGFHPYVEDVELDYPGWIALSAERPLPLRDRVLPTNRSRRYHDYQLRGTSTSNPRHSDIGLIHMPGRRLAFHFSFEPLPDDGAVLLTPPPDRGVVDDEAALRHQLFDIP